MRVETPVRLTDDELARRLADMREIGAAGEQMLLGSLSALVSVELWQEALRSVREWQATARSESSR